MELLTLGISSIVGYGFCHYQNNCIDISRFNIKSNNVKDKIKVLQLSDLHGKQFGKNNKIIKDIIFNENPDIVVATGDLIDSNMKNIDKVVTFLCEINRRIKVFYIPGNNEMRCKKLDEILYKIQLSKISVLVNNIETVKIKSTIINVLGLVENRVDEGEHFYDKTKSRYFTRRSDELLKKIQKMNGLKLVLSHYPENFKANKETNYSRYKFDIMFSGHAHGGQFILPVIGGLFAPGQGILPKYYNGLYGTDTKMIVSRGLGNSGFPLRLFNRPNIVIADII